MPILPPSTADYVRFHALHRPSAVALVDCDRQVTYAQFHRDLKRLTRAMRMFGLPAGSSVAVQCEELYLHWLILLACEGLGLVSASFLATEHEVSRALLEHVDLAISEHDVPASWTKARHLLTQAWVDQVLSQDEPSDDAPQGGAIGQDQPQRIRRSSGSTGTQKMMVAHRAGEENALRSFIVHMGFSRETRLLITSYFTVASTYMRATACLRVGATCMFDARLSLAQAIAALKPTHVRLFQYQAAAVLRELPENYQKPDRLTVMLGAGPLSDDLRRQILGRLATDIVYTYNTNETLMIAVIGPDGIATPRPGAEAEVVDEDDKALPPGRSGRIRVKTDSQVDGYLGDPDATADLFRNGWFYTGDAGIAVVPPRLRVLGRVDEVLNLGGLKYLPSQIEDAIIREVRVQDAGVTSIPGERGAEEIGIAVVLNSTTTLPTVADLISKRIVPPGTRLRLISVEALPRTETGKIQRHRLRSLFQQPAPPAIHQV